MIGGKGQISRKGEAEAKQFTEALPSRVIPLQRCEGVPRSAAPRMAHPLYTGLRLAGVDAADLTFLVILEPVLDRQSCHSNVDRRLRRVAIWVQPQDVSIARKRRVEPSASLLDAGQEEGGQNGKGIADHAPMLPLSKQTKWTWARISD